MSNPGAASTVTTNVEAVMTPVNTNPSGGNSTPQGTNDRRLLAVWRNVNLAAVGGAGAAGTDFATTVINSASWYAEEMLAANGQVSGAAAAVTTASIGIHTVKAGAAVTIVTDATLASLTAAAAIQTYAIASTAAQTAQTLYLHLTASLANATCDVFLYGMDLS